MRYQGLGRKENPTERAIVEVVHPDGTYDCRVPGRPHPYTRLQTCGGQRPLHVGQTVEVAFVDYQRTGRRWMPFILGASKSHLGSGTSRGRVSRGLAWHNGVEGTPDYTGSLYSLDTGYRKWRLDTGWSIPGPWVSIVGYTTHQGYIVTLHNSHLRCYDAASGQLVWQRTVSGAVGMRYNPTLQELLAISLAGLASFTVLNADTGEVVWSTSEGVYHLGGLGIVPHLDRIYNLTPPSGYAGQWDPAFARWVRTSAGYQRTAPLTLAHPFSPGQTAGHGLGWSMSNISPSGTVGYTISNRRNNVLTMRFKEETYRKNTYNMTTTVGWSPPSNLWWDEVIETPVGLNPEGILNVNYQYFRNDCKRVWSWGWKQEYREGCWGLLDLATETCDVRESFVAEPPPVPTENYSNPVYWQDDRSWRDETVAPRPGVDYLFSGVTLSSPFVPYRVYQGMAADGSFYGSYVWDSQGNRWGDRGNYSAGLQPAAGPILVRSATIVQNAQRHVLWSGPSGDFFTGHGGESTRGEDPWVLVASPGGWHFRDFRTGAVLGPWAGRTPVMVSAGIIYDTDDDGNLRRWVG